MVCLGAVAGGLVAGRLMTPAPDGWTGIAQALGGLLVGALAGGLLAGAAAFVLSARALWLGAAAAFVGALALLGVAWLTRPHRPPPSPPGAPPKPKPTATQLRLPAATAATPLSAPR